MTGNYKLDGHTPVRVEDTIEWAKWFEKAERKVAHDTVNGVEVSTVFLGIDHSFGRAGPPVLFETMVFGGELNEEQERYRTWDEAVRGHAEMLARVAALPSCAAKEEP